MTHERRRCSAARCVSCAVNGAMRDFALARAARVACACRDFHGMLIDAELLVF
jgi:hypothetical protein